MTDEKPLNTYNEKCNKCGQPTEPLFGSLRICRKCEGDKKPKSDWDEYGFTMRELTPEEQKRMDGFEDPEITQPIQIDLSDLIDIDDDDGAI